MTTSYVPTCPECGRECFVPSVSPAGSKLIWWCRDMGHWSGSSDDIIWKVHRIYNEEKDINANPNDRS